MPGEFAMQGFRIVPDVEYPCRRKVSIPADYAGKTILLRCDGVYSFARVWVNGTLLREHSGGFTSWQCDITENVLPGAEAEIVVGVTDRSDDISQASYYAKHSIAGILRSIQIIALPRIHLSDLSVGGGLDDALINGRLTISAQLSSPATAYLSAALRDPSGKAVPLPTRELHFNASGSLEEAVQLSSQFQWSAEHPDLYNLELSLIGNGEAAETFTRSFGFRKIKKAGNRLLVNGNPVKLRGVCRHSIHPLYGRAVPAEFDALDAKLFREANINFVRTSHYPPSEAFLDACDRYGIYVEEEIAVCWSILDNGPSSDPAFEKHFLSQWAEMLERDRARTCVLLWSLGNESEWGSNFAQEHSYLKKIDVDRPAIFSYPDTAPWGQDCFDIYSKHYADVSARPDSHTYPLLNDEYAHISCYNLDTLKRDPGVRNYWGKSIRQFWENMLSADGCLGGAIWAGIDEVFLLPDGPVGYGPWGIVDEWRRPKPEYWLTKKAYSPIRIQDGCVPNPGSGAALSIPIANAFDHTNLNEVEITWRVDPDSGKMKGPDVAPHLSGYLTLPARRWSDGEVLELTFYRKGAVLLDRSDLLVGVTDRQTQMTSSARLTRTDSPDSISIAGSGFEFLIDREAGLVSQAIYRDRPVIEGGPYLDFGNGRFGQWLRHSVRLVEQENAIVVFTSGEWAEPGGAKYPIDYEIRISGDASIVTQYRLQYGPPKCSHLGIGYLLSKDVDRLTWERRGLWSNYPGDHIGRNKGLALRHFGNAPLPYRQKPEWPWSQDNGEPFLFGAPPFDTGGSNDFRSLNEGVVHAACYHPGGRFGISVEAATDASVRASVEPDERVLFTVSSYLSYPDLAWGNYTGPGSLSASSTHRVQLRFIDHA